MFQFCFQARTLKLPVDKHRRHVLGAFIITKKKAVFTGLYVHKTSQIKECPLPVPSLLYSQYWLLLLNALMQSAAWLTENSSLDSNAGPYWQVATFIHSIKQRAWKQQVTLQKKKTVCKCSSHGFHGVLNKVLKIHNST